MRFERLILAIDFQIGSRLGQSTYSHGLGEKFQEWTWDIEALQEAILYEQCSVGNWKFLNGYIYNHDGCG